MRVGAELCWSSGVDWGRLQVNNCLALSEHTRNLESTLNDELGSLLAREKAADELRAKQSAASGRPRPAQLEVLTASKCKVNFDDIASDFLVLATHVAKTVELLVWKEGLSPLCAKLVDAKDPTPVEDVTILLGEFLTVDCRAQIAPNLSQRIAKELIERVTIAYFDRLLEVDGRVDVAVESGLLDSDLETVRPTALHNTAALWQ